MATLTFSITSGPVTGSKTFTLSDADVNRWIAAEKSRFGIGPMTAAQTLAAWAQTCVDEAKARTLAVEQQAAIAAANISPISAT